MPFNLKSAGKVKNNNTGKKSYQPIPAGEYYLRIEKASMDETKTGKEVIALQLRVEDHVDHEDRVIWKNFFTTPKAMPIFVRFLDTLGLGDLNQEDDVAEEEVLSQMIDKTFLGYVSISTYNNKSRNELGNFKEDDRSTSSSKDVAGAAPSGKSNLFR